MIVEVASAERFARLIYQQKKLLTAPFGGKGKLRERTWEWNEIPAEEKHLMIASAQIALELGSDHDF